MKALAEHEAKTLLRQSGLPTTTFYIIKDFSDLKNLDLKYPVVLKISSSDIVHKTDAGAIILDIYSYDKLVDSYKQLMANFPNHVCIVENMEKKGVEIIVGLICDDVFGKCIMVGVGGIYTEVYNDVSFRMLPISKCDAEEMIEDLHARKIFHGYRKPVDFKALQELLVSISDFGMKNDIIQFDLNPVFLYEKGFKIIDASGIIRG